MRTSSRAELGKRLRRDQTRCVEAVPRCGLWCAGLAVLLAAGGATALAQSATAAQNDLPDAPSTLMSQSAGVDGQQQMSPSDPNGKDPNGVAKVQPLRPCKDSDHSKDKMPLQGPPPCIPEDPIQPFV